MTNFLYFKYALWADLWLCPNFYTTNMPYGQTYALIFILQICRMGRLMPNFLYFNVPYGQTYGYAQISILQICHMHGRPLPKFLYFKYAVWALMPKFLYFKYSLCGTLSQLPNFYNIFRCYY